MFRLFLNKICKENTVEQNAPWLCYKYYGYEFSGTHIDKSREVAEEIVRRKGQQDRKKKHCSIAFAFIYAVNTLREQCSYTQNGLAERAGVSQTHLRRVERGEADITVGHLQLLCDAMNVSLKEFFSVEEADDELAVALSKLSPKQKKLLLAFLESL